LEASEIAETFKTHKQTSGSNKEKLIARFLENNLPGKFGFGTGLIVDNDAVFSNQADVVVYDRLNNKPLHSDSNASLFFVESVYALFESKSNLTPSELRDSIEKGRRFKLLRRQFAEFAPPTQVESLFVILAFDSAEPTTFKNTFAEITKEIPQHERPDFVVIPDKLIIMSGSYHEITKVGAKGSEYRQQLEKLGPDAMTSRLQGGFQVNIGENSLLEFFVYFSSWLLRAGSRAVDPTSYVGKLQTKIL
jgi:hypothetical protein